MCLPQYFNTQIMMLNEPEDAGVRMAIAYDKKLEELQNERKRKASEIVAAQDSHNCRTPANSLH